MITNWFDFDETLVLAIAAGLEATAMFEGFQRSSVAAINCGNRTGNREERSVPGSTVSVSLAAKSE